MTADNAPVLIVVIGMFVALMVALGAVQFWSNLPHKTDRRP